MTAHALKGTEEECLSYGMDGYISKPLNRERFINLIETRLCTEPSTPVAATAPAAVVETVEVAPPPPAPVEVPEPALDENQRLVYFEKMAEHVGDDPETQQQVVTLCLQALETKLPLLRRAIKQGDLAAIQPIAHYLRGSIGMLGLPALVKLGEEVEYQHDDLGKELWRQRCEKFVEMLDRVHRELQQLRAA
jgi:HPt (histidine-containing phosphotransfer) domain-containing protein